MENCRGDHAGSCYWISGAAKGMGGDSVGNYTPKLSARLVIELDDSTDDCADDR